MHPKDLSIADFTYTLPYGKIAQHPLSLRDDSKLLVYKEGNIEETIFSDVSKHLPKNSTIVFNDSKVIHARIIFKNEKGASIEVFLLEPVEPFRDLQLAMFQHGACTWRCLVGNAKKWREASLSKKFTVGDEEGTLKVMPAGKEGDDFLVHFSWQPEAFSFAKILEASGDVPLPPYIKREAETDDDERYQTLYAIQDGSVAAPTAGLHFSESVLHALREKDIHPLFVTLHVGAGTFKPVKALRMKEHHMHAEQFVVQKEMIGQLLSRKDEPVIAVGTTSCRTLESLYWLGKKIYEGKEDLTVDQWEPYETPNLNQSNVNNSPFTINHSLLTLHDFLQKKKQNQITASTKLIIAPGYDFKVVDGLVTNFHLPNSTLLLLVAAFIGPDWRVVYDYALNHEFRFLSYGDGSLLWKRK